MPEFLGPVTLKDGYDPAIQIGPAKGVTQFSLSLFAQTTDPNNSYPAMVQFWRYPWDEVSGFNINGDPILESGERFFAGNTQGALYRGVAGARFRNYVAGKNAVLLAEIDFRDDPVGSGGTVSSAATTTGGTSGGGAGVTFLGRFTPAQWPPPNPSNGDVAAYADLGVEWLMEYRSATTSWRIYNGDTGPFAVSQWQNVAAAGALGNFTLGVGGTWAFQAVITSSVAGSASIKVGTTLGGSDIWTTGATTPPSFGLIVAKNVAGLARSQVIYVDAEPAGGVTMPAIQVAVAPVTLNNA